jgi:hypothetical protein
MGHGHADARVPAPAGRETILSRTVAGARRRRGHDAREFARHGYDVVAVDFARDAAHAMREAMHPDFPHAVLEHDFFQLDPALDGTFDYVLEYTCYCAIDPRRRAEYADKIAQVLKRGGKYIALAFPLGEHAGGPPFAVNADELIQALEQRGMKLLHREFPPDTIKPRKGREELLVVEKT